MRDMFGGMGNAANQGMGDLGSMANQGLGSLGSLFNQIIQSWGSMFSQLASGGGSIFSSLFDILKGLFDNFFKIFGSLTGQAQGQITGMYQNTGNIFASVMKLKLNPEKNANKLKQEILAVKKIMESKHAHPNQLVSTLKAKAPQLTSAVHLAFVSAKKEYQKHFNALHPEAKKGVQNMHLQVAKAKLDIGSMISSIMGMGSGAAGSAGSMMSSMMSMAMNLMSNFFSLFKMFF